MPQIRIKIATTTEELEQLFHLRHKIFVDEEKLFPASKDGRTLDRFDAYPTTLNLIGICDGKVVAGSRMTRHSEYGNPADSLFDFKPHFEPGELERALFGSMLCVDKDYRQGGQIIANLLMMSMMWAHAHNASCIVSPMRPIIVKRIKSIGGVQVVPDFLDEASGLYVSPMLMRIRDLPEPILQVLKSGYQGHFIESFNHLFISKGEVIYRANEPGGEAFLVVSGKADVGIGEYGTDSFKVIGQPKRGDMFGEISLMTNKPRATTAIAATDMDLMVLDRQMFDQQIMQNPEHVRLLLEAQGKRQQNIFERLVNSSF